jgi:microsomal epoxide hydrolase
VKIEVADEHLEDLRRRLDCIRLPDQMLPGTGWSRGADLSYVKSFLAYWHREYDWRAWEQRLNNIPQYIAEVDGTVIHFLHLRSHAEHSIPLLLLHGWPGSILEFIDLIEPLTAPESGYPTPAFDLVIPSLPGYGFSSAPTEPGWDVVRVAAAFDGLMTDTLDYRQYGVHGGDWGGIIATVLGCRHAANTLGIHVNFPMALPPPGAVGEAVSRYHSAVTAFGSSEQAYGAVHMTKPMSLAIGQTDSPAALAGWILEKFQGWHDPARSIDDAFGRDWLASNLMMYWLPRSVAGSLNLYFETGQTEPEILFRHRVETPTGIAIFPHEFPTVTAVTDDWYRQRYNVQRLTRFDSGGHFAAREEPDALIADIRAFFGGLRR